MKKKITAFEFAIMKIASAEDAKNYEPYTRLEENQMRLDRLIVKAEKMQIKHKK